MIPEPAPLLGRSGRRAAVAGALSAGGAPASIDSVGPQDQIADEMCHEDEEQPPAPPQVVRRRLHLAELDHREVQGECQRHPHDDRGEPE